MEATPKTGKGLWNLDSFKIGTLTYTRGALLTVMFWMLWADLCLQVMEQLPNIIPLQLKWLGASDRTIGFVKDSLQAILTLCFVPVIGMQSDRHRGPMGRRRPFLLWCSIPVCTFLILLGFAGPLTSFTHGIISGMPIIGTAAQAAVGVALISLFAAGFFFFNNYIIQVYQYLVADVVPREVMGSFIGLYRAIGAVGAFIFNRWIFGYAESHVSWIYTGGSIIYAVAFFLLVWRVKEGEYPAPDLSDRKPGPVEFFRRYAKECFSHTFYLKIFSVALFFWAAWVPFMTFVVFYATRNADGYAPSLGVSVDEFGKIKAWTFLPQVIIFAICGPLIDRFHALRIILVGITGVTITYFSGFLLASTPDRFLVWWIINQVVMAIFMLAYLAMFPALFPRDKYGQYFSANQLFFSAGLVVAPFLCGWLMDILKDYRYLFIWSGACAGIAMIFAFSLFRHWKRLGGDTGYVAPIYTEGKNTP
jgi:maltose/moltooligosaccharide transporter